MYTMGSMTPWLATVIFAAVAFFLMIVFVRGLIVGLLSGPQRTRSAHRCGGRHRLERTSEDWVCEGPGCHTRNPIHARYCRMCGQMHARGRLRL